MGIFNRSKKIMSVKENEKTLHRNLKFTATEQYKLLRANLSFTLPEDCECAIIGVTSAMRGEGKSTTAVNLSFLSAFWTIKGIILQNSVLPNFITGFAPTNRTQYPFAFHHN